jgi:hypothetical protein
VRHTGGPYSHRGSPNTTRPNAPSVGVPGSGQVKPIAQFVRRPPVSVPFMKLPMRPPMMPNTATGARTSR